jgi:hypothetical protein
VPDGDGRRAARVHLFAIRPKPHPYLLLTADGWQRVASKVKQQAWARMARDALIERAERWSPPPWSEHPRKVFDDWTQTVALVDVAVAWNLTGRDDFRDKIVTVLRRMTAPDRGYLAKGNAVSSDGIGVHEGMFFCYLAAAYDSIYEDSLLGTHDHDQMRKIFYRYLDETERLLAGKLTYNYSTCANAGGILAALVLQDPQRLERQLYGPGGFAFQIASGVQGDGWHQEGATNYYVLILRYYMMAAAACENWGINLYDCRFPAQHERLIHQGTAFPGYLGMSFENWGPAEKSSRGLRDMLDGLIPAMDHEGVVLANNDSRRHRVYDVLEQAYCHYRDPDYAWVAARGARQGYESKDDTGHTGWRQLLYGVDSLPDVPDPRSQSALLCCAGLGVLRSQTPGRAPEEQITAVLKWGTHGGWHGHFDRVSLLALERYGHPLLAPFAGFTGYMTDQYKMWDQASASHNMVVVDQKMQEAVAGKLLLHSSHPRLQVCAAETRARWCQVPDWMKHYPPKWGENLYAAGIEYDSDAEPVLQRRLLALTDDYLIVADYLQGEREHTFDWLIHLAGLKSIDAAERSFLRAQPQGGTERVSSYRFFTDCQWHTVESPSRARFDDGTLKTDVHLLWPEEYEEMTAHVPPGRRPNNSHYRGTLLARIHAPTARFLAVLEPFRDNRAIESVEPLGPNSFRVKLTDGREQEILIAGMEGETPQLHLTLRETRDGRELAPVTLPTRP